MGRPKKTGCSQNAGATTYRSANHLEFSTTSSKQQLLTELFLRQDNNPTLSSVGVNVNCRQDPRLHGQHTQSSEDDSSDSSMNSCSDVEANQNLIDG